MLDIFLQALPSIISVAVVTLSGSIYKLVKSAEKQRAKGQEDIRNHLDDISHEIKDVKGTQYDLLRDRLLHLLTKYLDQGFCCQSDRENLERLFRDYKIKLHGNGTIEDMYNRVCVLPFELGVNKC